MSTVSGDDAYRRASALSPQPTVQSESMGSPSTLDPRPSRDQQYPEGNRGSRIECEERIPVSWTLFYLGCALIISWLYYRNPSFWGLMRHARYWLQIVRQMY